MLRVTSARISPSSKVVPLEEEKNMPRAKVISSIIKIAEDNIFLQKLDQAQRQWQKIQIARKLTVKSDRLSSRASESNYSDICRERYLKAKRRYNKRLIAEIKTLESMQPTAYDAMRFHRQFAVTTLWPPLHSKQDINWTLCQLRGYLSEAQKERLRKIAP